MLISQWTPYLKTFLTVARHASFSEAARELLVTQSAVSQSVKKLEGLCGFSLFQHEKNHFQLSPEGRLLFEKIEPIIDRLDHMAGLLQELRGERVAKIRMGCMHSFALALLPSMLASLKEDYPQVEVDCSFGHGGQIIERVRAGEIDFGIVLDNDDLSPFASEAIFEGHYDVFKSSKGTTGEGLILSEPSFETNELKKRYFAEKGEYPKIAMNVASWEVIAALTEEGLGHGYFPDYLTIKHTQLERVPMPFPSVPYAILAVFRPGFYLSKPIKHLLEMDFSLLSI